MLVVAADDGIQLPMSNPGAVVCTDWSLGDVALVGHDTAGIIGPIPLTTPF